MRSTNIGAFLRSIAFSVVCAKPSCQATAPLSPCPRTGCRCDLKRGSEARVSFTYRTAGAKRLQVCLFYNRRFRRPSRPLETWEGSYTAFFDPDYSVLATVFDSGSTRRHWFHFDAKYRLEAREATALFEVTNTEIGASEDEEDTEYDQEITRIHKREDLFKMHTYRDGILGSRGAYILFPGDGTSQRLTGKDVSIFIRHPSAFGGTSETQVPKRRRFRPLSWPRQCANADHSRLSESGIRQAFFR